MASISNPGSTNPVVNITGCSGNGDVSITVEAGKSQDIVGNSDLGASSQVFSVDNIAPDPPSVSSNNASASNLRPTWNWDQGASPGAGDFRYKLNDADLNSDATETTATTFTPQTNLSSGDFTLYVQEKDLAGNWSSSGSLSIQIDVSTWYQEAYLKASNAGSGDHFGRAVAISEDTVVVGARHEDSAQVTITNGTGSSSNNAEQNSGAAYVYTRTNNQWVQEAYIKSSNAGEEDLFGEALAISKDTIAVGAHQEDSNQTSITNGTGSTNNDSLSNSGAVYIYRRSANQWTQEAYIKPGNASLNAEFGYSIAILDDSLVVGSHKEDSNQTTITNGTSTSADTSLTNAGAVYVFKRNVNDAWAQQAYIKASNSDAYDFFGLSVSISGDTLVVCSQGEDSNQTTISNGLESSDNNDLARSGAVFIYKRTGNQWAQEAYVKASNSSVDDILGFSVAISGDTLAATAHWEDSDQTTITNGTSASSDDSLLDAGALYIYKRNANQWSQEAYIKASNASSEDWFGASVAISGDTVVVSAPQEDSDQTIIANTSDPISDNNNASDSGAAYIYKRTGNQWRQEAYMKASNADTLDWFGISLDISGDTLVVGSYIEDSDQTTITNGAGSASDDNSLLSSGAAYIYRNISRLFAPSRVSINLSGTTLTLNWENNLGSGTGVKIVYASGSTPPTDCNNGTLFYEGSATTASAAGFNSGSYSFRLCTVGAYGVLSQGVSYSNYIVP